VTDAYVALLLIDLHFPEASSLKGKRRELSSVKAQLHGRHGAAVSEVGHHDSWQRSTVAAVVCSGSLARLDEKADNVCRWLDARFPDGVRIERLTASADDLAG
jgi:uncharacterized protein